MLVLPASAFAAQAGGAYRLASDAVAYEALSGVANDVTISRTVTGDFRIHDDGGTVQATTLSAANGGPIPPDCLQVDPNTADCPAAPTDNLIVVLKDLDDKLTVTAAHGSETLLCGGDGADTMTLGPSGAEAHGGAGADTLTGGPAGDLLRADPDPATGAICEGTGTAPAHDTLDGGAGTDFLFAGTGGDSLSGGPGLDGLCGGTGDDTLYGGDDTDTMVGGGGNDRLFGGAGVDVMQSSWSSSGSAFCPGTASSSEHDALYGEDGNDVLIGAAGADTLDGGAGDDSLFGYAGNDVLAGGEGADVLAGYAGADVLDGGPGHDMLGGGDGDDSLTGGDGDDELGLTLNVPADDTGKPFTLLTENGNDTLDGGPGDDLLTGGPGATVLTYGGTNSTAASETAAQNGADVLIGGEGSDTLTYVNRTSPVAVSLDGGADDGGASEGDNAAADIETVVGGSGDDTLTGSAGPDVLDGGKGGDVIRGGAGGDDLRGGADDEGRDTIDGGTGDDTLTGAAGDDQLDGGDGHDVIDGGGGADTLAGAGGPDALSGGPGSDTLDGGDGNDTLAGGGVGLVGADGNDTLAGGAGDDTLSGGDGDDTLAGGPGVDTLTGDAGFDTADYGAAALRVVVTLDGVANDGPPGESDNVAGDVEAARGGKGDDDLGGDASPNKLDGGSGQDYLDGAAGADDLVGGAGADAIRARDGVADLVTCGAGTDIAIVDAVDKVKRGCEHVEAGTPRARLARAAAMGALRGSLRVRFPWTHRFVPLRDRIAIPVGSRVDAGRGRVALTFARDAAGRRRQAGMFAGGTFGVRQKRTGLPGVALQGGSFAGCASSSRVVRRLAVTVQGPFGAGGRNATVTAGSGAAFVVEDRCGGTFVRVQRGRVTVLDDRLHKAVRLRAGGSYLAKR